MKRSPIVFIGATICGSGLVVLTLHLLSEKDQHYHHASFERNIISNYSSPFDTADLQYNSYYIAGYTTGHIYLANPTAPFHVVDMNTTACDTQHIIIDTKNIRNIKYRSLELKIDSPYFYMADGTIPLLLKGSIKDWIPRHSMFDSVYFVDFAPINSASYAIKSLSSVTQENVLGQVKPESHSVQFVPGLLQKQIDGVFCTDGEMHYDKEWNKFVYIYYYRNQYLVTDSNLNLSYRGRTIDSISKAQIKVATITSRNAHTMAAPRLTVNIRSSVSGGFLFVNSNLMARNETRQVFDNVTVIDVYDLKEGKYIFSFHLPVFNERKVRDFQVSGNTLTALYEEHMILFSLANNKITTRHLHVKQEKDRKPVRE